MSIKNRFVTGMIVVAAMLAAGTSQAQSCWTNVASGVQVWSTSGNWTNGAPTQYGSASTILNFSVAGTYTSSNDWSGVFTNNSLAFGAGTVTLAGGTNAFMNNGAVMPVVTNYGATVTINNNLILGTNVTFTGAGNTTASGVISGAGSLTKTGAGKLKLGSTSANATGRYPGPTYILAGTLISDAGNSAFYFPTGSSIYLGDTNGSLNATFQSGTGSAKNGFNGNIVVQSGNTGTSTIYVQTGGVDNGALPLTGTITLGSANQTGHDVTIYTGDSNTTGIPMNPTIKDASGATSYGTVTFRGTHANNYGYIYYYGNSTYQGATVINDALTGLYIGNPTVNYTDTTDGRLGSGPITNNGALYFARTDTYGGPVSNAISGTGLVSVTSGILTLAGSNTFSGVTTVSSPGKLKVGSSNAFIGTGSLAILNSTVVFDLNGYNASFVGSCQVNNNAILTNSGTLAMIEFDNCSGFSVNASGLVAGNLAMKIVGNGGVSTIIFSNTNCTFSGGLTLLGNARYQTIVNANCPGTGPITVGLVPTDKAGIFIVSGGSSIITNDIVVNSNLGNDHGGNFRIDGVGNILSGTLTANVDSKFWTYTATGSATATGRITGPAGINIGNDGGGAAMALTLNSSPGLNDYNGNTTIQNSNATLVLGANDQIPNGSGKGNVSLAGILDLNGCSDTINGLSGAGVVSSGVAGAASLTVGDNNQTCTFSGTIKNTAGTLSLTKIGSGTLTLSGVNTYNGATWVNAGKFVGVTGGSCSNSALILADGATNSVSAVMGGSWSCSSLVCTGGTTTLDFDFGSLRDTMAPLNVSGGLSVTGTVNVVVRNGDWPATGTYPLVKYGSNVVGPGSFALTLPPGVIGTLKNNTELKQLELDVTSVPLYTSQPTSVWTNKASGAWSTPGNWTNSVPDGSDVVADFSKVNINAGLYVNVDSARTIGTLVYNNSYAQNLTVSNSPVTLATMYGVPAILVSTQTVTISSALQGIQGFIKSGSGTLTLVGNNKTYTGPTIIKAGTLVAGAAVNYDLGLSTGTTVYLGDSSGGNDATIRFNGVSAIFGNNFVVQSGNTGTALIFGNTGNITFNGTITLGTANSTGHSLNISECNGSKGGGRSLTLSGVIQDPVGLVGAAGTVFITGGYNSADQDVVTFNAANTYTGDTRLQTIAAPLASANNQGLKLGNVNALQNSTLAMDAADTGSICFNGNNTFVFGGLKGTRGINVGYSSTAGTVTLNVGNNNQNTVYSGQLSNIDGTHLGALTKIGTGTLTLGGTNTYSGVTTVSNGFICVSNNLAMSTNVVTLSGGGIAGAAGMWAITNVINLSSSATFDTTGSLALMGPLTNSGALTKIGAGTLILSATNTYRGGTTVNNGNLAVNGSVTGAVTVVGGTLGGTGVVAGVVTNFATIGAIDTSTIGMLTVSNLVMKPNSSYAWNYTTSGNTDVYVNGNLSLPTVVTVNVTKVSGRMPNSGVLFMGFTNNLSATDLSLWVINGAVANTRAKVVGNQIVLQSPRGTLISFK